MAGYFDDCYGINDYFRLELHNRLYPTGIQEKIYCGLASNIRTMVTTVINHNALFIFAQAEYNCIDWVYIDSQYCISITVVLFGLQK